MRKQHFTYSITRTIDIEVECVYYPDYEETEIIKAIDCATGAVIELEDHEVDECMTEGTADHHEGLKDAEDDRRYEDWKLERLERDR
tara:strand:+ start:109 stop:369 length:261 start_codon:yes stop_codon:yes gene_type:complete